jgi:sulfonate transport system substrate-binding protein
MFIGFIKKLAFIAPLSAGLGVGMCAAFGSAAGASPQAIPSQVPPGTTLRVADQFEGTQLPLQLSGAAAKLSFPISWSEFVGGPAVIQALEANAVDVGVLGDVPLAYTQVGHSGIVAVAITQTSGHSSGIVSAPGAGITNLKGLRGKNVAYTASTAPQGYLYSALASAGLNRNTTHLVDIAAQSNVTAALQSHAVDAAALTYPLIATYLAQNPTAHLLQRANLSTVSGQAYIVTTEAVLSDPAKEAALGHFLRAFVAANQWRNTHASQWVQAYYVGQEKLTTELGTETNDLTGPTSFDLVDPATIQQQQRVADLLTFNRAVPRKLNAAKEFATRFNPFVSAALRAIGKTASR